MIGSILQEMDRTMKCAKVQAVVLICFLSFLFIVVQRTSASVQTEKADLLKYEVTDAFFGRISQQIIIGNPTDHAITNFELMVPLIRNETARHYIFSNNITSSVGQAAIKDDAWGNEYAEWNHLTIDSKGNLTFRIDYLELSFATQYQINRSDLASYDTNSELYRKFTESEPLIESDNPEIITQAQNLTIGLSNPADKASRIYSYVTKHLDYVTQEEERGALWALKNGTGDCSEYSYLFVALCRAAGIPARVMAGFAFYKNQATVQDGHMWAEYYLEDYSWIPVDATWGTFNSIDSRHLDQVHGIPQIIRYVNYVFASDDDDKLKDEQTVTLRAAGVEDASLIENAIDSIVQVKKTSLAVSIINPIGTWIFPEETAEARMKLTNAKVLLQNGIENLNPESFKGSLGQAMEASRIAWTVLVRVLAIILTVIIITMSIILILLKRRYQG